MATDPRLGRLQQQQHAKEPSTQGRCRRRRIRRATFCALSEYETAIPPASAFRFFFLSALLSCRALAVMMGSLPMHTPGSHSRR